VAEGNPVNRNTVFGKQISTGIREIRKHELLIKLLTAGCALPQQLPILLDYFRFTEL